MRFSKTSIIEILRVGGCVDYHYPYNRCEVYDRNSKFRGSISMNTLLDLEEKGTIQRKSTGFGSCKFTIKKEV